MPHQKVLILQDNEFALVGPPSNLHSDSGRNFKSHILWDLCLAFGVKKSHTSPYFPIGDGLEERMNRSLYSLLEHLWMTEMTVRITYSCCYSSNALAAMVMKSISSKPYGTKAQSLLDRSLDNT